MTSSGLCFRAIPFLLRGSDYDSRWATQKGQIKERERLELEIADAEERSRAKQQDIHALWALPRAVNDQIGSWRPDLFCASQNQLKAWPEATLTRHQFEASVNSIQSPHQSLSVSNSSPFIVSYHLPWPLFTTFVQSDGISERLSFAD